MAACAKNIHLHVVIDTCTGIHKNATISDLLCFPLIATDTFCSIRKNKPA